MNFHFASPHKESILLDQLDVGSSVVDNYQNFGSGLSTHVDCSDSVTAEFFLSVALLKFAKWCYWVDELGECSL